MNKKELERFIDLYEKFENVCIHFCSAISDYDNDYKYLDTFSFPNNYDEIVGTGYNFYYDESVERSFNAKLLLMNDVQLANYVTDLITKRNLQNAESEKKRRELKEKEDRKLYEELKKKFG